jgi:hypothetical protein
MCDLEQFSRTWRKHGQKGDVLRSFFALVPTFQPHVDFSATGRGERLSIGPKKKIQPNKEPFWHLDAGVMFSSAGFSHADFNPHLLVGAGAEFTPS